MKRSLSLAALSILCMAMAANAPAEDDWANAPESYLCRSSNEVREIKTYIATASTGVAEGGLRCRVDYIKNGSTQTIWSSRTTQAYCGARASQLVAKLEAGNFSCKPLHLQQ